MPGSGRMGMQIARIGGMVPWARLFSQEAHASWTMRPSFSTAAPKVSPCVARDDDGRGRRVFGSPVKRAQRRPGSHVCME